MAKRMQSISEGFSMIEVMVSVLVVAVGLLAVANFQGGLMGQSSTNKARAEATALAQARIEQLRNYTNDVSSSAEFDTLFAATGGFTNAATVTGVNAQFTRAENVAVSGDMKEIAVRVTWTGSNGRAQQVTLDTELSWESPRTSGDVAREDEDLIPSPTGRAVLGEGYLPDGAVPVQKNGDGTAIYDTGDGNLRLALGDVVVLTLKDACLTGTCIDFATISGRVYIDTASQRIAPGEVFVKASDAAFCQRYWEDDSGSVFTVQPNTISTISTANGDYEYFDYTCYLGGGWFGNIGLILGTGISQTDKACMGDPVSVNSWEEPVIAFRRAYRGMLYKQNPNNASGKEEYADANGNSLTRYWSVGITDALVLPASGDAGHDFVLASMRPGDTTGDNCISQGTMVRTDSGSGTLFAGMPTDFVCLNPGNVDAFDASEFGVESNCPYDPTEPPTLAHKISGSIVVAANEGFADIVGDMFVSNTDGPGNCVTSGFAYDAETERHTGKYVCNAFDWGSGWTGSVLLFGNFTELACEDTQLDFSGLASSTSSANFTCEAREDNPGDPVNQYVISGTAALPPGNFTLTSVDMSSGTCVVTGDSGYSCELYTSATEWSGTLSFTSSSGYWCGVAPELPEGSGSGTMDNSTGTVTFTGLIPGSYTFNPTVIKKNTCNL